MRLIKALRYSNPASAAFVGAGGKTTAIFQAARELLIISGGFTPVQSVLVTTTTHLGTWQAKLADHVYNISSPQDIQKLEQDKPSGAVLLYGEEKNDRLCGLLPKLLEGVHRMAEEHSIPYLIEADGAHTRPLKAPAEHEPVIPDFIQMVVVVAGLSGLGKPINDEWIHRSEKFSELAGTKLGEIITGEMLEKVLLSDAGGLKNIPPQVRRMVILNQADTPELQSQAKTISERLLGDYQSSIISSLRRDESGLFNKTGQATEDEKKIHAVIERTAGIILAAGSSSRFGEAKQLLMWKGEPLIRHVVRSAIKSGLSPLVVVVGSSSNEVQNAIKDLHLRIVNNSKWMGGMSTSIKAGLSALTGDVGGVVFLQADQPQIPPGMIKSVVEAHQSSLNPIIAPQIDGQRGNPVLFDADTFADLLAIEGDMGGRALFSRYPIEWVTWHDPRLLLDIDSPEDYQIFLRTYPDGEVQA
jgi:molybdenum cofactor cytidylyltransferase